MMFRFPRRRFALGLLALVPLALGTAGCSWFKDDYADAKCPGSGVVTELASVTRYGGPGHGYGDLAYRADLGDVSGGCEFDHGVAKVTIKVTTLAEIGPAGKAQTIDLPYFVAVVDNKDKILAKRVLPNPVEFHPNRSRAGAVDIVTEAIPVKSPKDSGNYRVVIGFQLTPEELAVNRQAAAAR
jgi:hypothetical protein